MTEVGPRPTFPRIGGKRYIGSIALAGIAAFALLPAGVASAHHHQANAPKHKYGRGTSTNWSGYAVDGTSATDVVGNWTQPAAICSKRENSWSSPWVGIDGDNSSTVEQIGTDADCSGGRPAYYAWYEMYPKSLVVINIPVNPGDSFTGRVTYQGSGNYLLTLTNNSTSPATTFSTVQNSTKTQNSSIEWVMEGPSNGSLTNFTTAGFPGGSANTVNFTGASGTIGGTTAGVGSFGNAQSITMVGKRGIPRATPFGLSSAGFGVLWNHH